MFVKFHFFKFERIVNHSIPLESGDGADQKYWVISRPKPKTTGVTRMLGGNANTQMSSV